MASAGVERWWGTKSERDRIATFYIMLGLAIESLPGPDICKIIFDLVNTCLWKMLPYLIVFSLSSLNLNLVSAILINIEGFACEN